MINICIVGLGHIGGSLGKALVKAKGYKVFGFSRKAATLKTALKIKACNAVFKNIAEIKNCDVIVLCVPVDEIANYYKKLAHTGAVITDVGSVKSAIETDIAVFAARQKNVNAKLSALSARGKLQALPAAREKAQAAPCDFVGAHPMAGKEFSGIMSADETIFKNTKCVITGSLLGNANNERLVAKMWRDAGCEIIKMSTAEHDYLTALTSHLPHVIAFSLQGMYNAVKRKNPKIEKLVAGSFKSATRVAKSKAQTWQPILNLNRAEINKHVKTFLKTVKNFNPADITKLQK